MHWRQSQPALRWGDIRFIETSEPVLAFTRHFERKALLAVFHLGDRPLEIGLLQACEAVAMPGHGLARGESHNQQWHLRPYGAWFVSEPSGCVLSMDDVLGPSKIHVGQP